MKIRWSVVHDADDDKGNPTIWSASINGRFWWICLNHEGRFTCEIKRGEDYSCLAVCKSLSSAKRWVNINHWKYQEG